MSAPATIRVALEHSPKLVVGIGGTGKIAALAYTRIAKLLGIEPEVAIVDFPPNEAAYTAVDRRVDSALDQEGVRQRVRTLPLSVPNDANTLRDALGLDQNLADAIFTADQQNVSPIEGANQQPQVGAAVARWKLNQQADRDALQYWFGGHYTDIFILSGLGGGTGAGFGPTLCQYAKENARGKNVIAVFLLPWAKIGQLGVGDAGQNRNAKSLLRYLDREFSTICDYLTVIGAPRGVDPYDASVGLDIPVHSTLLLAALFVMKRESWGGTNQPEKGKSWWVEVERKGIPLQEIAGPRGNLLDMLAHSRRIELFLRELVRQFPADRLASTTLWPLGKPLSWDMTEWLVNLLAKHSAIRPIDAWRHISNCFTEMIRLEAASREWIMDLAESNRELVTFNRPDVEATARTHLSDYFEEVKRDVGYRRLALDQETPEQASGILCSWARTQADALMLDLMKRRKK
jgi:hypothetical protein